MSDVIHNPTKGVTWILVANCLERLAYYGFRGIVILFLVDQVSGGAGWSTEQALEFYAEFTMYTYLAVLVGGLCIDFVFGAYFAALIGCVLMALGYASLGVVDEQFIYYSTALIVIGASLFKPSIPTILTQQLQNQPTKLDSIFTGQYLVVNLGAAVGPLVVGTMGENIGWSVGFSLSAAIVTLVFIILVTQKRYFCGQSKAATIKHAPGGANFLSGAGIVLITSLLSIIFWCFFELGGNTLYQSFSEYIDTAHFALVAGVTVSCCMLFAALWWFLDINGWFKIAVGFLVFALSWWVLEYATHHSDDAKSMIMLVAILHAVAEVLCSVIFFSLIAKHAFKPLLSTSFSIHLFAGSGANYVAAQLIEQSYKLELLAWICLGIALVLVAVQFFYSFYFSDKSEVREQTASSQ